mgnify:CR=1 FL=1
MVRWAILPALLLSLSQHAAWADASQPDASVSPSGSGLKFSGFGTLGFWQSNGPDDLQFRRELGQNLDRVTKRHERSDSRLGLQLNYQATEHIELVGQVVAREKADSRVFNSVEWAFLKYRPTYDTELRLGRVGLSTFMLSDYRNVGYAYHWVRPPTEFYGWIPFYSLDGGDAVHAWQLGDGQLRAKVYAGKTESGMPWGHDSYKLDAAIFGMGVAWESDAWRLRAYHTNLRFQRNAPFSQLATYLNMAAPIWASGAEYADDVELKGQRLGYSVLGATWDHDGWQLATEIAFTTASTTFAPQGTSAYLSLAYRVDSWLPYVSFARSWDQHKFKLDDPIGGFGLEAVADQLRYAYKSTHTSQYTASVGVRWDFADRMALKMQWDRTVVSQDGTQMWGYGSATWNGAPKHVWSATLDFAF